MTLLGHIENGVIVLDEATTLPDGMRVRVEFLDESTVPTIAERLKNVIGQGKGLPADLAENHDHYVHGAPLP
jgi:hypothetical protein